VLRTPSFTLITLLAFTCAFSLPLVAADPPKVKVIKATRADVIRYVTLPGTLYPNQQATLYAKVPGYLKSVAVDKGDSVKMHQLLAQIEVPELIAESRKYEADERVATVELSRLMEARKKAPDLVTQQSIDKAEATADVARANLQRVQTLLGFTAISAPFDGVVTHRFLDNGAFVPAATSGSAAQSAALFTVMETATLRARVAMPELETVLTEKGQPVKITLEALPGKQFEATVSRKAGSLDEATRTMIVEADLANSDGTLYPGMYATVRVGVAKHTNTITVPVEAITMDKANAFVFKFADGKAKKTAVTLGFNDGARAELLTGAQEGDQVIAAGKVVLTDGQAVQPIDGQAL
jgi:RND family efflux transporter MFP subunit